jgi:hypothetical protein
LLRSNAWQRREFKSFQAEALIGSDRPIGRAAQLLCRARSILTLAECDGARIKAES